MVKPVKILFSLFNYFLLCNTCRMVLLILFIVAVLSVNVKCDGYIAYCPCMGKLPLVTIHTSHGFKSKVQNRVHLPIVGILM